MNTLRTEHPKVKAGGATHIHRSRVGHDIFRVPFLEVAWADPVTLSAHEQAQLAAAHRRLGVGSPPCLGRRVVHVPIERLATALPAAPCRRTPRPYRPALAPQDRPRLALGHPSGRRVRTTTRSTLASLTTPQHQHLQRDFGDAGRPATRRCPSSATAQTMITTSHVDQLGIAMSDRG